MTKLEINQLEKEIAEKANKLSRMKRERDRYAQIVKGLRKADRGTIEIKVVDGGVQVTRSKDYPVIYLDVDVILDLREQGIRFTCYVDTFSETGEPRLFLF